MKIASKIRNRDGSPRRVHIHGKLHVFAPVQDKHNEIHDVADVTDADQAATLLGSDAFYAFGADKEKKSTLTPAGGSTKPPAETPPAHTSEDLDAAALLLKGSAGDIGKAVGSSTVAIIRAAIDVEGANAKPRQNVLGLLQATLDGIVAAGGKA